MNKLLNEAILSKIAPLKNNFPAGREGQEALVIPLLHAIQEEHGHISMPAMREAAQYLELPLLKIREVATFYTVFNKQPKGKLHIQMCTNICCWLKGADQLLEGLEKRLAIKCGESTSDGHFSLSEVECLASCGTAPVMQVGDYYFENLTEKKVLALIDAWEQELKENRSQNRSQDPSLNLTLDLSKYYQDECQCGGGSQSCHSSASASTSASIGARKGER